MISEYRPVKRRRRKRSSPNSMLYQKICLHGLRKCTKKSLQAGDYPISDLISGPQSFQSIVRKVAKPNDDIFLLDTFQFTIHKQSYLYCSFTFYLATLPITSIV
jgi:hypothetical protein